MRMAARATVRAWRAVMGCPPPTTTTRVEPILPLAGRGCNAAHAGGVPRAGVGDPILDLSRQPTAALTPAFPLASEAAPRTLNV